MTVSVVSSNEFASLVNQLQQTPEDPNLKRIVIKHLPKIRELAQKDPLALYHLAQIYPPNSSMYKQTMLQSADLGCTNAMLEACSFLLKSANPKELKQAEHYLQKIKQSQDTYIIKQADKLFKEEPAQASKEHTAPNKGGHQHRFFSEKPEKIARHAEEQVERTAIRP